MENDGRKSTYLAHEKVVIPQPGDGHCIIHSVRASLGYSTIKAVPSVAGLLEMVRCEILGNLDYYRGFSNSADMAWDLNKYITEKSYDRDTLDLVIFALANCLGVVLRLFAFDDEDQQFRLYTVPIVPGRRNDPPRAVLDILKASRDHYDALVDRNVFEEGELLSLRTTVK